LYAPHINSEIDVQIASARVEYNPLFVDRITKIAAVDVKSEELKQATLELYEEGVDAAQNAASASMNKKSVMKLMVYLASPVIVLPFKHNGKLENEAWVVKLGDLLVNTNDKILEPNLPKDLENQDIYDINLKNIKVSYYKSI